MKIKGLTIFCFILGTYSLSLDRKKRQADLTENATKNTTLPSVDITSRYAGAYPDSNITAYKPESHIQKIPMRAALEDRKENFPQETVHSSFSEVDPQQNYNSEDDFSAITTVRPSEPPPSYFSRFLRNAANNCNFEAGSENSDAKNLPGQDPSNFFCTERTEENNNDDANAKVNDSQFVNVTEITLHEIDAREETTDVPKYKNTEETVDDTQVESSGQDTDDSIRVDLGFDSTLIDRNKTKRQSPGNQNVAEDVATLLSEVDVDNSKLKSEVLDYEQSWDDDERPGIIVRAMYGISYLFSIAQAGTSNVIHMFRGFFH